MAEAVHPLMLFASIGRLHIVAIAALGTLTFGWLFTGHYPWLLTAVSALDWFLVNLLNRVVDLDEDRANAVRGTAFAARHRRAITAGGFALLVGSLAAVHFVAPAVTPLRIGFHLLGLAYNWPILPVSRQASTGCTGRKRIKELYFWKNTASTTGFVITVFGLPLAASGWRIDGAALPAGISNATILCSAAFFVLFELSYEVIYDLRDAPGDAAAGVRSYPVVHGRQGAVRIVDGLIVGSLAVLVAGYGAGALPWRIFIMAAAPALQLVAYKRALRRGITAEDCVRLTWLGAGLLLGYHLWVVAGLPGVGLPA